MQDPVYSADLIEQERIERARARECVAPAVREWRAEVVVGGLALAAMAGLWAVPVEASPSLLAALACIAGMAVCSLVRFDVGGGFTVPVQLAFVPLLFAVPPQAVPVATAVALLLARVPAAARGRSSPLRLSFAIGNAWFAIGPAWVLLAVGGSGQVLAHPVLAIPLFGSQFLGDFAASALREGILRGAWPVEQLREAGWVYGVDDLLTPVPFALLVGGEAPAMVVAVTLTFVAVIASFARERRKRLDGLSELSNAYHGTALLLGDVVGADDGYTGEHCRSVVELALDVGRRLGLDARRLRNLEFSALLHDIGKVAIPKEIINKPGALDAREWEIIKTHTLEGQRMLDRIGGFMGEVGRIVRSHHERWDGGGYLDGLVGREIPLEARIVTACDSWNAMTTTRAYRAAMPFEAAVAEMRAHAGTQFDPGLVEALLAVVAADRTPAELPVRRAA